MPRTCDNRPAAGPEHLPSIGNSEVLDILAALENAGIDGERVAQLAGIDADGYLWLTGRKKDLIIRGGHNIDPAIIEDPLYRLPQVQLAAVVGRPDAHAGEVPVAYVQAQKESGLTPEAVLEYLRKEVGERAAIPKQVVLLEAMPLTPVGKIFKPALRWDAIRRVYESELAAVSDLVESLAVEVAEDKVHGALATVVIRPAPGVHAHDVERRIAQVLGRFTVRYTTSFR